MANRGFPPAQSNDGKPGFPYQQMNGNYQGMYYPGQEMTGGASYGQYPQGVQPQPGVSGETDPRYADQCSVQQSPYGFVPQPYMALQHYSQQQQAQMMQAQAAQAAYCNSQPAAGRMGPADPQRIADSIYSMAAHAYNYQQQGSQMPQQPAAPPQNAYNPAAAANHSALTVHTSGHSPANSMNSPAGSTHSAIGGERPMVSPHVQSNTQQPMYNSYHPSHCQPQQQQPQMTHNNINYYNAAASNSANGHQVQSSNNQQRGGEVSHRQSLERLASISSPPDSYNNSHAENQTSTGHNTTNTTPAYYNKSVPQPHGNQYQQQPSPSQLSTPKHNQRTKKLVQPSAPTSSEVLKTTTSNQSFNSNPKQAEPKLNVKTSSDKQSIQDSVTSHPVESETSLVNKELSKADDIDSKPKEAAVDSGIDSEQVDTHHEEENDTSTTSNRSENSPPPQPFKSSADLPETLPDGSEAPCNTSEKQSSVSKPKADVVAECEKADKSVCEANLDNCKEEQVDSPSKCQESSSLEGSFNCQSPTDNLNSSFTSNTSRQSNNDESRLPPRKRKHQLSEHTDDDPSPSSTAVAMPPKKRGRPTKEAVRQREAAKAAEAARLAAEAPEQDKVGNKPTEQVPSSEDGEKVEVVVPQSPVKETKHKPKKERKPSVSVTPESLAKPVHSGVLLQSPKLSVEGMNPALFKSEEHGKAKEKKKSHPPTKNSDSVFTSSVPHAEKKEVVSPGSNAVKVSPPKKPKASVSEMQKALMRAVSNDNAEAVNNIGKKRKRGRPPGSKNRRTKYLEQRARSYSTGSDSRLQYASNTPGSPCGSAVSPMSQRFGTPTNDKPLTVTTDADSTYNGTQSQEQSSSVQKGDLPQKPKRSNSVSPKPSASAFELKLPIATDPWVCVFCHQITNYQDMGDLYGGYNLKPDTPVTLRTLTFKKSSEQRQIQLDSSGRAQNEIWFHEKCIAWAPGAYVVGGKLYGLYEAICTSFHTTCSGCKKKGAILGCFSKGCPYRYHIHCAQVLDCVMNEENFSMFCPKHKEKKIKLV